MKKYFYTNGKYKEGPFTLDELRLLNIQPMSLIWYEGLDDWTPAGELAELSSYLELFPPLTSTGKSDEATELQKQNEVDSKMPKVQANYKSVGGWLLVLCVILTVISPARVASH